MASPARTPEYCSAIIHPNTPQNRAQHPHLPPPPPPRRAAHKVYHHVAKEGNYRLHAMNKMPQPPQWLGLLRTCRQIHDEANLLPYTLNSFSANDLDSFNDFFRTMKKYSKMVDTVRLQVAMGQTADWEPGSGEASDLADVLPSVRKMVVYCVEGDYYMESPLWSCYLLPGMRGKGLREIESLVGEWLGGAMEEGVEVEFVRGALAGFRWGDVWDAFREKGWEEG